MHTLLRWGDRLTRTAAERLGDLTTSVDAERATGHSFFAQRERKFYIVPQSKVLSSKWQERYKLRNTGGMVWNPHKVNSVPADDDTAVEWRYDPLRKVIEAGDSLCRTAKVTQTMHQTEKAMRGWAHGEEEEVEFEVVAVASCGADMDGEIEQHPRGKKRPASCCCCSCSCCVNDKSRA